MTMDVCHFGVARRQLGRSRVPYWSVNASFLNDEHHQIINQIHPKERVPGQRVSVHRLYTGSGEMSRAEIETKIAEYAVKLAQLDGPESKRVKKRVLQALGKLKKQLLECGGSGTPSHESASSAISSSAGAAASTGQDDKNNEDSSNSSSANQHQLTRKQLKSKLKLLNKELAEYAQKKQLKLAKKRFNWGLKKGMEPDKHTFANMINCYVRCGDMVGALGQISLMKTNHVVPNVVIYTTLLKGYADSGDLTGAKALLFEVMTQVEHSLSPFISRNFQTTGCLFCLSALSLSLDLSRSLS